MSAAMAACLTLRYFLSLSLSLYLSFFPVLQMDGKSSTGTQTSASSTSNSSTQTGTGAAFRDRTPGGTVRATTPPSGSSSTTKN